MASRFILSLDCEGKWGVAHHLGAWEHQTLGDERLRLAYRSVIDLLDEFDIPATFAFVGLFGEDRSSFRLLRPVVESLAARSPAQVGAALHDIDCGSREGWHGDWAVEAVGNAAAGHEIALQGVTHVPWDQMDQAFVAEEMALYGELSGPVRNSRTMVYPSNRIAFTRLLPSIGIEGYRLSRGGSRVRSLSREFNIFAKSERGDGSAGFGPVQIPAGYFVNWQRGLRRLVPLAVSENRFARLMAHADATGGIVHFWLHPENIASAPATLDLLRMMAKRVAAARDAGRCAVLTQRDYCREAKAHAENPVGIRHERIAMRGA